MSKYFDDFDKMGLICDCALMLQNSPPQIQPTRSVDFLFTSLLKIMEQISWNLAFMYKKTFVETFSLFLQEGKNIHMHMLTPTLVLLRYLRFETLQLSVP